jgi:hypothetical protein
MVEGTSGKPDGLLIVFQRHDAWRTVQEVGRDAGILARSQIASTVIDE